MKRNIILFSIIIIFMIGLSLLRTFVYGNKYEDVIDLEDMQQDKNEKYITAQILSDSLDNVYTLFEENLKDKSGDKDDVEARKFREELFSIFKSVDGLEWKSFIPVKRKRKKKGKKKGNYIYNVYNLEFECSYIQFGKLVTAIEASERLITINEFNFNNSPENVRKTSGGKKLPDASVTMQIASITLKK